MEAPDPLIDQRPPVARLADRHGHNVRLFLKFGIVGGSGVVVNLAVFSAVLAIGGNRNAEVLPIPGTEFHVRMYHVYSTIAFLVANASNYLLNRWWTFRSRGHSSMRSEYAPFLLVGTASQGLTLLVLTMLLHPQSPIGIDNAVLAQLIAVMLVVPVSFLGNKLWTFRAVRHLHSATSPAAPEEDV